MRKTETSVRTTLPECESSLTGCNYEAVKQVTGYRVRRSMHLLKRASEVDAK